MLWTKMDTHLFWAPSRRCLSCHPDSHGLSDYNRPIADEPCNILYPVVDEPEQDVLFALLRLL